MANERFEIVQLLRGSVKETCWLHTPEIAGSNPASASMITETSTQFFPCECGSEGLTAVCPECDWDGACRTNGNPRIMISFWGMGHGDQRWRWGLRWRCIWNILRRGKPYDDMVCMRSEVARKFAQHILSLVDGK